MMIRIQRGRTCKTFRNYSQSLKVS